VALEGSTGLPLWTRPTSADFADWRSRHAGHNQSFPPLAVRAGEKRNRVAVAVPWPKGGVILYDASGESAEHDFRFGPTSPYPLLIDIDSDGTDEMVLLDEAGVNVLALGPEINTIWTYPMGPGVNREILGIVSRRDAAPILATRTDATDNSVIGLDSATGQRVWTCPGPVSRSNDGVYIVPSRVSLLGGRPGETPLVFYAYGSVAECRHAAGVGDSDWETLAARGVAVQRPKVSGVISDPRWKRDLPWHGNDSKATVAMVAFLGWCVYFSLSLILIPGFLLIRLVARRQFGLQALLALPVVAALAITATLVQSPPYHEFQTTINRVGIGVMTAPPLIAIGILTIWTVRRRWLRLTSVAIAVGLATIVCGLGSFMLRDGGVRSLLHESYEWSGWHDILLPGAYMTAWLLISAVSLRWVSRRLTTLIIHRKRHRRVAAPLVVR
jgi:hypothetical protein